MAETKTYRHRVTGMVTELHARAARAMGDVLVEVRPDAKPLRTIGALVAEQTTSKTKEKKDD